MLFSLCKHIIAIKNRNISSSLALVVAIRRDSIRLHPVRGGLAVKGCRDCVGSRAPQLAFFHLSACLSAEMTDGGELRANGGPQKALCPSVTHKKRQRYKSAPKQRLALKRMFANYSDRWVFFLWLQGFFLFAQFCFFLLKQISLYKCSSTLLKSHHYGKISSSLPFAFSVQMCDMSSIVFVPEGCKQRASWTVSTVLCLESLKKKIIRQNLSGILRSFGFSFWIVNYARVQNNM